MFKDERAAKSAVSIAFNCEVVNDEIASVLKELA